MPIAIFVSGGGRTLRNIAQRIEAGNLPAKIVLVVASKECPGVDFARAKGISTLVKGQFETPD